MDKTTAFSNKVVAATRDRRVLQDSGLAKLKECQRKNAEEVAAGTRSARSLWAVAKGDLKGMTFRQNPASKYAKAGTGW